MLAIRMVRVVVVVIFLMVQLWGGIGMPSPGWASSALVSMMPSAATVRRQWHSG
ncbi:hypothetical protein E2C01_077816 [Portunus trituberculatus]|uniref:Uncharacterized protein n=1 Tax=Portunus trituberculatus TaxID=210409 RepID=A0A5B7ISH3_PORTR|nr:hypothetical protein [Portunus trituberculatus]